MVRGTQHSSFRKRLLLRVGIVVGLAFLLVEAVVWGGATIYLRMDAERFVRSEADEISSFVVRSGGELLIDAYPWNEPHHLFNEPRIDPLFVQIMNPEGQEIYFTPNIDLFNRGAYPRQMVTDPLISYSPFQELESRFVGSALLYFSSYSLRSREGQLLGFVQIARYLPDLQGAVRSVGLISAGILLVLLGGLLFLLHLQTGRLLAPLHRIARTADSLSAEKLDGRVPDLVGADRESVFLASAFNRLLDRLDGSFNDMRRFTADASHQLQTPLTVVKGHVDVALRKPRSADSYQRTLKVIGDEVDGLTRMSRSLLLLSRLDSSMVHMERRQVHLADLVTDALEEFSASSNCISVQMDEAAWVMANEELCLILVRNLVENALKYGESGPVVVKVTSESEYAVLTVQDEGVGIKESDLNMIRDLFYRSDTVRDLGLPGNGLGLALVDRITAWHGGTLSISSHPPGEVGFTRFSIRFPLAPTPLKTR